jgi:hypothetical protein
MNGKIVEFGAAVSLLAVGCVAKADIVEFPLDCAGVYDFNTAPWSTDFDLGISFTDISDVYVDWQGEIIAALVAEYSNPDDPFPIDVGIGAYLEGPPFTRSTSVWRGAATYPDPEAFDQLSEIPSGTTAWADLLDGQGTVWIYYKEAVVSEGWYVEHGSADLASATLVVDGTVVPEPATLLLFGLGAILLRSSRRVNRPGRRGKIH